MNFLECSGSLVKYDHLVQKVTKVPRRLGGWQHSRIHAINQLKVGEGSDFGHYCMCGNFENEPVLHQKGTVILISH